MDFGFEGFEASDFDVDVEDIVVKKTGKYDRIWRVGKGGSVAFHTTHDRYVYFGAMDCYVYKINCITGKVVWRFKTNDIILGRPSEVYDGMIFVGSYDTNVYAIDFETGKEIWRFKTGGKIGTNHAIVHKGMVYIGSQDGYLYCIDSRRGKELWRFKTGDEIACTPSVHENMVFIGSFDGNFYAIDSGTGKEVWRFKTGDNIQMDEQPLVYNGMIFVTSFDNYLRALSVETGQEIWRFRTGKYGNTSGPKEWNGVLYQGTRDGFFYAIDLNGKELWRFKCGSVTLGFGVHKDNIYITSEDGNLYCLSPEGKEVWRFKTGGGIFDFPTFYDNKIHFGSWDCNFYCVDMNTREELWRFETSSRVPAKAPPAKEQFKVEIKKETIVEDAKSIDKYKEKKEDTISLSEYQLESEYTSESEYKQKSDYDTNFVMFEGIMEVENLWISGSKVLKPQTLM